MEVQKSSSAIQLKDSETGYIHLHNLKFTSQDALNLEVINDQNQ
jgi:hypothetical protein